MNQTFDAQEAEQALRARGWQTDAGDPVNAIRSALSRLVQWSEIERVDRGRYALAKPKRRSSRGDSSAAAQREDKSAAEPETAQAASS